MKPGILSSGARAFAAIRSRRVGWECAPHLPGWNRLITALTALSSLGLPGSKGGAGGPVCSTRTLRSQSGRAGCQPPGKAAVSAVWKQSAA